MSRTTLIVLLAAGSILMLAAILLQPGNADQSRTAPAASPAAAERAADTTAWARSIGEFVKPSETELRARLTPLQFEVTQQEGTEQAFRNEYWDKKQAGIYVDIISGEPLFSSTDKYKSGTGWPSFIQPIADNALVEHTDSRFFMKRTELRSAIAGSHLGHVFNDGPEPTGLRYCINSASMRFIPREDLEKEGYGEFLSLFNGKQ